MTEGRVQFRTKSPSGRPFHFPAREPGATPLRRGAKIGSICCGGCQSSAAGKLLSHFLQFFVVVLRQDNGFRFAKVRENQWTGVDQRCTNLVRFKII